MVRGSAPRERGPAFLTVIYDNREIQRRPITNAAVTVGRNLDCDLWLEDPLLSRHHCKLEPALEGDGWIVTDLDSRNGMYVNAKRTKRSPLNHKDVITIGKTHLKFHAHGYLPPRPADPSEALLMPAHTKAALERAATPHCNRPLPTPSPKATSSDSTVSAPSPGETVAGDRTLAFTRPPARPIVKDPDDE